MTEFIKLNARVRNLAFISEKDAAWLAVRTLLISTAAEVDFCELYLGMLGLKAREAYVSKGIKDHLWPTVSADPLLLEAHCRHAHRCLLEFSDELSADIVRVGPVIQRMTDGATKATALKDTQSLTQKAHIQARSTGADTKLQYFRAGDTALQSLWKKYSLVLPYIYAEHLQSLANMKGMHGIRYDQLAHFPYAFKEMIKPSERTKPIRLNQLQVIEFQ